MKQLFAIFFSVLILLLSVEEVGIYAAFKLNQEFIANNFCININKPEANCSGKCFLKKELKDNQEEKQSKDKLPQLEETQKNYYYSDFSFALNESESSLQSHKFDLRILIPQLFPYNFLDPPEYSLS